jgi:hypothetical protein
MKMLGLQLEVEENIEGLREFINESIIIDKIKKSFKLIKSLEPDIVLFPEMCYIPSIHKDYLSLSYNRLIVAGSHYNDQNENITVIYQNGKMFTLPKIYPSPDEPMFLSRINILEPTEIILKWENEIKEGLLPNYFFKTVNNKIAVVLNCIDYYKLAYYIARSPILSKDLLILLSPCSNNRVEVFIEESKAIHNHNVNIYSFIINACSVLNTQSYAVGKSYLFGVIDPYSNSNQFKSKQNIEHFSSILNIDNGNKAIFIDTIDNFSLLKRSDLYQKNPKNIQIIDL